MDFAFTEEQDEIRATARRYLTDRYPSVRVAELADSGARDVDAWAELDRQGWLDPELGMVELALLAEESGRVLHPVPWWASAGLALPAYRHSGRRLPGPATLADGRDGCRAYRDSGSWRLDGRAYGVVDAASAIAIVVAAWTGTSCALFGVRADAPGIELVPVPGVDPLRPAAELRMTGAPAQQLVPAAEADAIRAETSHRAGVMLAAEAAGVAGRALEFALEYAGTRVQFGRPIGSYQAVAHQLADGYAELELARSLAYRAACTPPEAGEPLACATTACTRAAVRLCETAIQVTGGLGVTWEYPLHRWYRRALWLEAFAAAGPDPVAAIADFRLGPVAPTGDAH